MAGLPCVKIIRGGHDVQVPVHEFHYASIEGLPADTEFTCDMQRGFGVDGKRDGVRVVNTLAGFCHIRNTADYPWVVRFPGFVARYRDQGDQARFISNL